MPEPTKLSADPAACADGMPAPADPALAPPRRRRRWGRLIALQLAIGTVAGLAGAEWMFHRRDRGAFPHVNFYVPDAQLGVRLEPGAEMRFQFRDNPISDIRVNSRGYRGGEWPAAGTGEIVVIGDSQVFGLGVEEHETFSARLAELTGRNVVNAGVPTYGPLEYLAVTRELLAERKPKTVVYVLNFVNDGFELDRPNRARHAVWDGWAVRIESAPQDTLEFPGRRWLFRNSHAFYAARKWWWSGQDFDTEGEKPPAEPDTGLPSEGTWRDLIAKGEEVASTSSAHRASAEQSLADRRRELALLGNKRDVIEERLNDLLGERDGDWDYLERKIVEANPGDIVDDGGAEESRSVLVTASLLRRAVEERDRRARKLIERASKEADELVRVLDERSTLARTEAELRRAVAGAEPTLEREPSVFAQHLAELKAACDEHGAELVVVALPIDVQVSKDEWAKYGSTPIDMQPSLVLLDETVADARALGAVGVQPTAALAAAEPGAFLDGDIHMTAKGHDALAHEIVRAMAAPRELHRPRAGLPEGRTPVPRPRAWAEAGEVKVRGSSDAGCRTQIIGEWFRVSCNKKSSKRGRPTAITVLRGDGPELMRLVTADAAVLLAPLRAGEELAARFDWEKRSLELGVQWPEDAEGKPHFSAAFTAVTDGEGRAPVEDARAAKLCACHIEVTSEMTGVQHGTIDSYDTWVEDQRSACGEIYGGSSEDCFEAFASDCRNLLACVRGEPLSAPGCEPDETLVAATNTCATVCDDAHPCARGTCEPYNGGAICRG